MKLSWACVSLASNDTQVFRLSLVRHPENWECYDEED